jgi:hypothetical protein
MEYRTIGKGEATIVDIIGRGLIDSTAQVTPSQHARSDYSQQRTHTEDVWDLWYTPCTVRYSP